MRTYETETISSIPNVYARECELQTQNNFKQFSNYLSVGYVGDVNSKVEKSGFSIQISSAENQRNCSLLIKQPR